MHQYLNMPVKEKPFGEGYFQSKGDSDRTVRCYSVHVPTGFEKIVDKSSFKTYTVAVSSVKREASTETWWIKARAKIKQLEALRSDWNGYNSEPPNISSVYWATIIVDRLYENSLRPSKIVPSAAGGIAVTFFSENKYADIEALNSGDIVALIKDKSNGTRQAWAVSAGDDDIQSAIDKIRNHIQ